MIFSMNVYDCSAKQYGLTSMVLFSIKKTLFVDVKNIDTIIDNYRLWDI